MITLKSWEPDEEKRYKHIIEKMIYVGELQVKNMFLYMCLVDPKAEYKLNIYRGDFLGNGFDDHMKNTLNVVSGWYPPPRSTDKTSHLPIFLIFSATSSKVS